MDIGLRYFVLGSVELRKFEEQFERVKRWYERFEKIDQGKLHDANSDVYQDEVYAFFLNCYHLKDWIKHDDTIPAHARRKVEVFTKSRNCLRICRDICIAVKHLDMRSKPLSGRVPEWRGRKIHLVLGGRQPTLGVKYSLMTGKGLMDAFDLATNCIREWEQIIKANIT
jgi:hypothetical protein